MKREKTVESSKPLEYVRTILLYLGCVLSVLGVCLVPKQLISEEQLYSTSVSVADLSADSIFLYDYKVYGTNSRLEAGLKTEVPLKLAQCKANDDILVVRVPADTAKTETFDQYILIHSPDVPELNIEFCLAKNVNVMNSSLPTRTFIKMARGLLGKATVIYLCLVALIAFLLFLPCGIFGTKALLRLIALYRKEKQSQAEVLTESN